MSPARFPVYLSHVSLPSTLVTLIFVKLRSGKFEFNYGQGSTVRNADDASNQAVFLGCLITTVDNLISPIFGISGGDLIAQIGRAHV